MTDGADGTLGKVDHTIDFRGEVGTCAEVHQVAEAMNGVRLQMPRRVAVMYPLLLDVLEIHVVVQRQGVGPREMFEQLDGGIDR